MFLMNILLLLLLLAVTSTYQRSVVQNNDCSFHSSNYSINWTFDELSNDIVFKLTSRSDFTNFYTAIGFGNEKPEDVIAVYVRSLQIGLIDGHLMDDGAIESDEKTNVQALQFDLQNGELTAQFARPVETFDSQDSDLGSCITMFFLTEPREIITGAPLELGNSLQKIRVCDIAVTCATKMHNDILVKRQEDSDVAPICSTGEDQKNRIEWTVDGDLIHFSVFQNTKKGRWWSAIGVGESMSDLNMILFFAENGRLKKQGIFRTEGKMVPVEIELGGIELKKDLAIVNNGKAHFDVTIEKKFFTDRLDEQGCFTMQIALLAGQYNPNFNIQKHQSTPTPIQICNLDACKLPVEPQQEIDGETPNRTDGALVKGDEDIEEASGSTQPTISAPINDVEGSGLPVEPKIENQEPKTTPHTSEIADEKPLTNDESPVVLSSSSAPAIPSASSSSSPSVPSASSSSSAVAAEVNSSSSSALPVASVTSSTPIPEPMTPEKNHVFAVDNQTTKRAKSDDEKPEEKANDAPEETTKMSAGSVGDGSKNGCGADHEDLKICESYFAEYLGKVKDWSEKHNMTVASHMWKACTLLSQVQHVTTMCCTIFRNTCASYLSV